MLDRYNRIIVTHIVRFKNILEQKKTPRMNVVLWLLKPSLRTQPIQEEVKSSNSNSSVRTYKYNNTYCTCIAFSSDVTQVVYYYFDIIYQTLLEQRRSLMTIRNNGDRNRRAVFLVRLRGGPVLNPFQRFREPGHRIYCGMAIFHHIVLIGEHTCSNVVKHSHRKPFSTYGRRATRIYRHTYACTCVCVHCVLCVVI